MRTYSLRVAGIFPMGEIFFEIFGFVPHPDYIPHKRDKPNIVIILGLSMTKMRTI